MKKPEKNPFKELENHEELPAGLKNKVMDSINLVEMLSGFSELFTANMVSTAAKMIPSEETKEKKK